MQRHQQPPLFLFYLTSHNSQAKCIVTVAISSSETMNTSTFIWRVPHQWHDIWSYSTCRPKRSMLVYLAFDVTWYTPDKLFKVLSATSSILHAAQVFCAPILVAPGRVGFFHPRIVREKTQEHLFAALGIPACALVTSHSLVSWRPEYNLSSTQRPHRFQFLSN